MEEKEGLMGSGVAVRCDEAPQSFRVEPILENSSHFGGSTAPPASEVPPSSVAAPVAGEAMKKKRGRPRKYAPDGSIVALSPMPISASIPLTGDYSAWNQNLGGKVDSLKKRKKLKFESPGGTMGYSAGGSLTPHVITVNAGEDVSMKILSFSQQGSRAICILAANGAISNVTLRQSNASGGTLTYEGNFEILSLSGSFILSDNGLTKSRTGGMSISLAGPDGRVLGGGLAGMLVAAGSVQVVIGSFVPGYQQEQKPKKPRYEHTITFGPSSSNLVSEERYEAAHNEPKPNTTTNISFHGNYNLASSNSNPGSKISDIDNSRSLTDEDSGEQSH